MLGMRYKSILFVCHGNICRSPMAEFVMKKIAEDAGISEELTIASCATSTDEIYHGIGNPVYPPAREELRKHNISCDGKRAVQMTRSDYKLYDLIIAMDKYNVRNIKHIVGPDVDEKIWLLLDFVSCIDNKEPQRLSSRDISDPWYTGDFTTTYKDVLIGCQGLLEFLKK